MLPLVHQQPALDARQGARPSSSRRAQRSVGGAQFRHQATRRASSTRGGGEGVVLGHRASSASSFLGMKNGDLEQPPRVSNDEALLTMIHQLRSALSTAQLESAELAEANQELRTRLALLEAGMPALDATEPEPEPEPVLVSRSASTEAPWPGPELEAARDRIAALEAAARSATAATPEPGPQLVETAANTMEPWLGPALAAANERIAVLEKTVAMEHEAQAKMREAHKVEVRRFEANLYDCDTRIAQLQAALKDAGKEAEEAAARDLRIIQGLEREKNAALVRAKEAEDELARLREGQGASVRQQMVKESIESVKIGIIAPKVTITFGGNGSVSAAPALPRDELQRVLETEVLPKFVRVLTNENPDAPPELVEPSASATPVGQSKWLHEHITAMRGAIEAQLTGVFSS